MNCWHGEYNDNYKVIKHYDNLIIDSKLIKEYFKKYHKVSIGGDYYDTNNWVIDPNIKVKPPYYNDNQIFWCGGSCKVQSYIEFITAIKTDKKIQKWYIDKFEKDFLIRKLNKSKGEKL